MVNQILGNIFRWYESSSFTWELANILNFWLSEKIDQIVDRIFFAFWIDKGLWTYLLNQVTEELVHVNKALKLAKCLLEQLNFLLFVKILSGLTFKLAIGM